MKSIFLNLLVLCTFCCERTPYTNDVYVHALVRQSKDTVWIYSIYLDSTLFIQQEYIPGLAGKCRFKTKEDAKKTAQLVINKIRLKQKPYISQKELVELGINIEK